MTLFQALILGVIEGLTEFLPISSTAHLILISNFLLIQQSDFVKSFEIIIQSGAILAVIFLYLRYIIENRSQILNLVVSFIPTAVIGYVFFNVVKNVFFQSFELIVYALFLVGILFIIFEKLIEKKKFHTDKSINNMNLYEAFIIGIGQSVAIIPGVSRAGAVIVTMMSLHFKRNESAIYSFLLAVPTILAATLYNIAKSDLSILFKENNIYSLSIGFITSFIVALIVIKWFIKYLQKNSLVGFGLYRITIAIAFYLILLM